MEKSDGGLRAPTEGSKLDSSEELLLHLILLMVAVI